MSTKVKSNSKKFDFKQWAYKNRSYFFAFFVPVIIMYIAYALFEAYPADPNGDNSVLVLDLNGQYVYYFETLRDAFWGNGSIFYSWYRNLSGEFMGIIGYYLASPFTLIVMLLPRSLMLVSLFIMQLSKLGAIGVTFSYYLQKSKKLRPVNSVIFSTLFALCAYAVIQLMDPMWIDGLIYLPLITLGIEYLVDRDIKVNYIIPLALMCIANFYIGYMTAIYCVLYYCYYMIFGSQRQRTLKDYFKNFGLFAVSSLTAAAISACMILPVYYSLSLGKFEFTDPDYSVQLQFTTIDLLSKLLPSSYDTVRNEGLPEIYCGSIVLLLIPLYYINSKIPSKDKVGTTFMLAVMFFSMYIKPIDMMWHGGQVPNWLPYRYSFIVSFILLLMAAQAFEHLDGVSGNAIGGTFAGAFAYLMYAETKEYENIDTLGVIWFTVGCIACFAILIKNYRSNRTSFAIPAVILVLCSGELTIDSYQTLKDIDEDVRYSKRSSYEDYVETGRNAVSVLENYDTSLYRSEKTFVRTVNDNMAFRLKGITHSSSLMNAKIIDLAERLGYVSRGHYTRYEGNTPITDSILGIKYVLDKDGKVNSEYEFIAEVQTLSDGSVTNSTQSGYYGYAQQDKKGDAISIYENPNALPIAYMVDDDILDLELGSKDNPFENQNMLLSSMLGEDNDYFTKVYQTSEPYYNNVSIAAAGDQTKYIATEGADSYIEYYLEADSTDPIYLYFPASYEKKVNIWLSTERDENGNYTNHKFIDYFYEGQYFCILKLGDFNAGQQFAVRCTVANEYTYMKDQLFYQLDMAAVDESLAKLQTQTMDITDYDDTHIKGTVNAGAGQVLFTSIPQEGGWTIKVDGKKIDYIYDDEEELNIVSDTSQGIVTIADSLIGIVLTEGTHEIEMSFFPKGLGVGLVLAFIGIGVTVFFFLLDYKKPKKSKNAAVSSEKVPEIAENIADVSADANNSVETPEDIVEIPFETPPDNE